MFGVSFCRFKRSAVGLAKGLVARNSALKVQKVVAFPISQPVVELPTTNLGKKKCFCLAAEMLQVIPKWPLAAAGRRLGVCKEQMSPIGIMPGAAMVSADGSAHGSLQHPIPYFLPKPPFKLELVMANLLLLWSFARGVIGRYVI
jgi:hypothetical protein